MYSPASECSYPLPYRQRMAPHWHCIQSLPSALVNQTALGELGHEVHLKDSMAFSQASISLFASGGTRSSVKLTPEQAMGSDVTPRSDLYSLGTMLYEMVTGRPHVARSAIAHLSSRGLSNGPPWPRSRRQPRLPVANPLQPPYSERLTPVQVVVGQSQVSQAPPFSVAFPLPDEEVNDIFFSRAIRYQLLA